METSFEVPSRSGIPASELTHTRIGNFSDPELRKQNWRFRLAWRLRSIADWIEGPGTVSYTLSGKMHNMLTPRDLSDAIGFGYSAICRYLQDVLEERIMFTKD